MISGCLGLIGRLTLFLLGPVLVGALVGWSADSAAWSAKILAIEPVFLILGIWAAYALWVNKHRMEGFFLATGTLLSMVVVRFPFPPPNSTHPDTDLPSWLPKVEECMGAVIWPTDGVRLLQWSLPGSGVGTDEILRLADALRPDLLVLSGTHDPELAARLIDSLGGEFQLQVPTREESGGVVEQNGRIILARGLFHVCGEASEWAHGAAHFSFAGVTNATRVPLLVTAHPGPFGQDWARVQAGWAGDLELAGRLQSPALIVVASAPALPTWRYLEESMFRSSLFAAPAPPSWPVRVGPLPMLPLQPHERLWAGPGWRITASERVSSSLGTSAPVLTTLEPAN